MGVRCPFSVAAVLVSGVLVSGLLVAVPAAAAAGTPAATEEPAATAEAVSSPEPSGVPARQRDAVLGRSWRTSPDFAVTTSGDPTGLHVLRADARSGYSWHAVVTLSEPGIESDQWIGNVCLTESGRRAVVVYAPRTYTNDPVLFERGAFAAVVDLRDGTVVKLRPRVSLAYYNPGCGTGERAVLTQSGTTGMRGTRLLIVDAARGKPVRTTTVPGQVTSAVPASDGIVAAKGGRVVRVAAGGGTSVLRRTSGVPYRIYPTRAGDLVYMERRGQEAAVSLLRDGDGRELARGPLTKVSVRQGVGGRVFVVGESSRVAGLPSGVTWVRSPATAELSARGTLALRRVASDHLQARWTSPGKRDPDVAENVHIEAESLVTGRSLSFTASPRRRLAGDSRGSGGRPSPSVAEARAAGGPDDPVDADASCAVPRGDVRTQVYQPAPPQVEWAADLAVKHDLTITRPANWKHSGLPAYSPQRMFPGHGLEGGGSVPASIMMGILAQESNMWQASFHAVEGVPGNPLIGDYYGRRRAGGWNIDWSRADCGYGVAQVTTGMRKSETIYTGTQKRAIAVDYAANIAAGVQILENKWNQVRRAGLTVNGGDAAALESWFYALWAYNTGFYPDRGDGSPWGVGWANNPINPDYDPARDPFLEYSYDDARTPQYWPYQEKVLGWAGHPIAKPEPWGHGYIYAWWSSAGYRASVKPPSFLFCEPEVNDCHPGEDHESGDGACSRSDFKCWFHESVQWKNCSYQCGHSRFTYEAGDPEPPDYTANYPPACSDSGLPAYALIIDNTPDDVPSLRPCSHDWTNNGRFSLEFTSQVRNGRTYYPSKIDYHQIGAGLGGHFAFAHMWNARDDGWAKVTGTWTLDRTLLQWARVMVHIPDHGAHTQHATYKIDLGDGRIKRRSIMQRRYANSWVSLGVFPFNGTPKVSLDNMSDVSYRVPYVDDERYRVDDGDEDVAWDAVAILPLPSKPEHIIVSLGDSFASGEGTGLYYPETDNNGGEWYGNACHASPDAWSRKARLPGDSTPIGTRGDRLDPDVDHQLIACSGAVTGNVMPRGQASRSTGQYRTDGQIDRGFLDENTTLVTISIGGNDARFGAIMAKCAIPINDPCMDQALEGETEPMSVTVPRSIRGPVIEQSFQTLIAIMDEAPRARIVLMGYPRLFRPQGCHSITPAEADWLGRMADLLAQEQAALAEVFPANVVFADPRSDFEGHDACQEDDVAGINKIIGEKTPGEDPGAPVSAQSFHPNNLGTTLYANTLTRILRRAGRLGSEPAPPAVRWEPEGNHPI